MAKPSLTKAIEKLAAAGGQAGFSVEQMIEMLNSGVSIETLIELISLRLGVLHTSPPTPVSSTRWVM
ncbi:MAG TPA: hypothetical protein VMS18_30365 [Candidatus Binatia bacterium]|nr:hypothetical protein [Candidatus Binatia bacterium]